jgi:uncharacterized membrane protein
LFCHNCGAPLNPFKQRTGRSTDYISKNGYYEYNISPTNANLSREVNIHSSNYQRRDTQYYENKQKNEAKTYGLLGILAGVVGIVGPFQFLGNIIGLVLTFISMKKYSHNGIQTIGLIINILGLLLWLIFFIFFFSIFFITPTY